MDIAKPESIAATALKRAVQLAGSQSAFGRMIGRNQSTVHDWVRRNRPLPAEHVLKVETVTGVSRHDLRPDLYPREQVEAPSAATADQLEGFRA